MTTKTTKIDEMVESLVNLKHIIAAHTIAVSSTERTEYQQELDTVICYLREQDQ